MNGPDGVSVAAEMVSTLTDGSLLVTVAVLVVDWPIRTFPKSIGSGLIASGDATSASMVTASALLTVQARASANPMER